MVRGSRATSALSVLVLTAALLVPRSAGFGQAQVSLTLSPTGDRATLIFTPGDSREMSNLLAFLVASLASMQAGGMQYPPLGYGPFDGGPNLLGVNSGGIAGPTWQGGQGFVPQGPQRLPPAGYGFGGSPLGNVRSRITSPFGAPRGALRHQGVDLVARTGTPLYALGSGTITRVYYTTGGGWTIEITYDNGFKSVYMHMRDFDTPYGRRAAGQRVQGGQPVGHSNNTGSSTTGAHLHFELVTPQGQHVDPLRVPGIRI